MRDTIWCNLQKTGHLVSLLEFKAYPDENVINSRLFSNELANCIEWGLY